MMKGGPFLLAPVLFLAMAIGGCLGSSGQETEASDEGQVSKPSPGPVVQDYMVDQTLASPAAGIAREWAWRVPAWNYTQFTITVDIQGFLDGPQYATVGAQVVLVDGAGEERLNWGGGARGSPGPGTGPAQRVLTFDGTQDGAPLGDWSLFVKTDAGAVQFHVVVTLEF